MAGQFQSPCPDLMPAELPWFAARMQRGQVTQGGERSVVRGCTFASAHGCPEGIFVRWEWNGQSFSLETDRYGAYPVFFAGSEDQLIVATTVHQVVAELGRVDLDGEAIALFLLLGYFTGVDTPFAQVRCLGPGGRLTWTPGAPPVVTETEWPRWRDSRISRDDAIRTYGDLFRAAIARTACLGTPERHLLSGGRDSRHILFELVEQGRPPAELVTAELSHPGDATSDVAVARTIAARLGIRHRVVSPATVSFARAEHVKNVLTGFAGDEGAWMVPIVQALGRPLGLMYDGLGGDVLSAGLFLRPHLLAAVDGQKSDEQFDRLFVRVESCRDERLRFARTLLGVPLTLAMARDRFRTYWRKFADRDEPLTSFFFYARTRRIIAHSSYGILRGVPQLVAPFLDNALFDFLLSLPDDMTRGHDFHDAAIAAAYPQWADIPYSRSHSAMSLTRGAWTQMKVAFEVMQATVAHRLDLLPQAASWTARYRLSRAARCVSRQNYLMLLDIDRLHRQRD